MAGLEFSADFRYGNPIIDRADFELGIADELVTGVEIPLGADGQIIVAGAAAGQTFRQAGAVA